MKTAFMFLAALALTFVAVTYPQKPSFACDPNPCSKQDK